MPKAPSLSLQQASQMSQDKSPRVAKPERGHAGEAGPRDSVGRGLSARALETGSRAGAGPEHAHAREAGPVGQPEPEEAWKRGGA